MKTQERKLGSAGLRWVPGRPSLAASEGQLLPRMPYSYCSNGVEPGPTPLCPLPRLPGGMQTGLNVGFSVTSGKQISS